jgi:hypothetical protein
MLSVIVSTRNDGRGTVATLAALVSGATSGLVADVLLLDCDGSEEIRQIAEASGCELFLHHADGDAEAAGNGLLLAAQHTRSPWLLFLQAGAVLQPGWIEETMAFIEHNSASARGRGAVFRYARSPYAERPRPGIARALWRWLPGSSPDKGLLISRTHYERLGGHPTAARRPEAKLLARLGRRSRVTLQSKIALP